MQHGLACTCDPEVIVGHESDLSSSKKYVFVLRFPFFNGHFLSEVIRSKKFFNGFTIFASSVANWESCLPEKIQRFANFPWILPNQSLGAKSSRTRGDKNLSKLRLLKLTFQNAKVDGSGNLTESSRSFSFCIQSIQI